MVPIDAKWPGRAHVAAVRRFFSLDHAFVAGNGSNRVTRARLLLFLPDIKCLAPLDDPTNQRGIALAFGFGRQIGRTCQFLGAAVLFPRGDLWSPVV